MHKLVFMFYFGRHFYISIVSYFYFYASVLSYPAIKIFQFTIYQCFTSAKILKLFLIIDSFFLLYLSLLQFHFSFSCLLKMQYADCSHKVLKFFLLHLHHIITILCKLLFTEYFILFQDIL